MSNLKDVLRNTSGNLGAFDPPGDAEPSESHENGFLPPDGDKPSVLTKLQKWADYPSVGSPVYPTHFLPMKTPMSMEIISNWSLKEAPKHSHTIPELLCGQAALGRQVGMVIDLANHDCLYAEDIPPTIEYAHVQLVAKVLPPREAINEVQRVAQDFWTRSPAAYIAIHCAYGFNRTGFVVCSYLCQACGMTVDDALDSFAAARPPGVKHGKFVEELYARYGRRSPSGDTPPLLELEEPVFESNRPRSQSEMDGGEEKDINTYVDNEFLSGASAGAEAELSLDYVPGCQEGGPSTPSARPRLVQIQPNSAAAAASCMASQQPFENFSKGDAGPSEPCHSIAIPLDDRSDAELAVSPTASSAPISIGRASRSLSLSLRSAICGGSSSADRSMSCSVQEAAHLDDTGLPFGEEAFCGGEDLSTMALTLNEKCLMRRETSLGLAKALHEDFGQHEGTPQGEEPSPLLQRLRFEGGVGNCHVELQAQQAIDSGLVRIVSVDDSENQSLGFGAREVLARMLEAGDGTAKKTAAATGDGAASREHSEYAGVQLKSDMRSDDWRASHDEVDLDLEGKEGRKHAERHRCCIT